MAEYLAPGVYIEEKDLKAPSIEPVSTTTTGMVGHARRGPVNGPPRLVTNMLQFRQLFGGPLPSSEGSVGELFYAAQGFFANGGRRLYVIRASGATASEARFDTRGGFITRLATGADAVVGGTALRLASTIGLRDAVPLTLSFRRDGIAHASSALAIAAAGIDSQTGDVTLAAPLDIAPAGPAAFPATGTAVASPFTTITVATGAPSTAGARPASLSFEAVDPGAWGNDIQITASHVSPARARVDSFVSGAPNLNRVRLASTAGFYVNAWVHIDRGPDAPKLFRQVLSVDGTVLTLSGNTMNAASFAPLAPATVTMVSVCEFALTVSYDGVTESYPSLTLANVPGKFVEDQINRRSTLINVVAGTVPAATHPFLFPCGDDGRSLPMTVAGVDDPPDSADMRGVDGGPGNRTGLRALEEIADIAIIVCPGWGDAALQGAMIEQCERLKYRVALLDPEIVGGVAPTLAGIQTQRLRYDSKYAAIYYPRVIIRDAEDTRRAIGPAGHMAGLCARVDIERGVFKSPGNETIRAITDLEAIVTQGEHEVLNPAPNNINVIRDFRAEGRGLRIYGARCITSASDWRYLAVRRLFNFIERSIDLGTQWAVLEPNDPRLWDRLIDSIDGFLTTQWRSGALLGVEKEDAYYIRCGTDTMTQDDIDNGRLVMEIGIAPVKPAEFVIIRIGQTASGSFTTES